MKMQLSRASCLGPSQHQRPQPYSCDSAASPQRQRHRAPHATATHSSIHDSESIPFTPSPSSSSPHPNPRRHWRPGGAAELLAVGGAAGVGPLDKRAGAARAKGPAGREMTRFLLDTTSRASDGTHGSTSLAQPQASQAQGQGPPPQPNRGVENCYVFKSRLQEYAQKAGLPTPEYHTLKEGPSHEPIFKSTVVINNTKYESLPGFFNRKAAEQSAAEVALMEIVKSIPTNANIPAVHETGLCKNLLQEYAQKMNYAIPSYICTKQASGIAPFICTVEIGGTQYIGAAARTKKEAEIKAARTALLAIQGQSEGCANGATKYVVVPGKRQGKETEKSPIETPKPLKVKKGGFKKKWNKRKFMKKNGQAVDVEKDEARVAGDVHDSDVPMHPTITAQVPSSGIIMLQPNEEARSVEPETPSDTVMVQPNEEARIVNQEPASDTAMPQPNEEARRVEQESLSESATVHTNRETTNTKEEPPSNSAIMQCNKEARTVNQEPPSSASLLQPNKEPRVANSKSVYEHENQCSGVTSLETNKSNGDVPGMVSDPSSTAVSKE